MAKTVKGEYRMPAGGLASWMKQLSLRRQELIRPVFENPGDFVLLSVRAAAEKLNTDPATVVRIAQRMGFENYRSFQHFLRDLLIANTTPFEGMQKGGNGHAGIPHHLNATMEQDVRNLRSVRTHLDPKRLASLAKRIRGARRRLILGGDLAGSLVHYFEYTLTAIGLPVMIATSVGQTTAHYSLDGPRRCSYSGQLSQRFATDRRRYAASAQERRVLYWDYRNVCVADRSICERVFRRPS